MTVGFEADPQCVGHQDCRALSSPCDTGERVLTEFIQDNYDERDTDENERPTSQVTARELKRGYII